MSETSRQGAKSKRSAKASSALRANAARATVSSPSPSSRSLAPWRLGARSPLADATSSLALFRGLDHEPARLVARDHVADARRRVRRAPPDARGGPLQAQGR